MPIKFSIKQVGKSHEVDNLMCPSCDQTAANGGPLDAVGRHYPYRHMGGNPPCSGLVHAEVFDSDGGWEILYRCDTCGAVE
jgi:hypothetical protein